MPDLSLQAFQPQSVTIVENGAAPTANKGGSKKGGFSFGDFIDMINPLHHIPVVGQVYRAVTGDQISDTARMAGGGLFAGPLGIGIAAATISMRGDKTDAVPHIEEHQAPADTNNATPTQDTNPSQPAIGAPLGHAMAQYEQISQRYWTQSNLNALAQSMAIQVPEAGKTPEQDDAPTMTDQSLKRLPDSFPAQPVPKVSTGQPLSGFAGNNAIYAQMMANLDKLEAIGTAPR